MPQSELLKKVIAVMDSAAISYMLTGSYASSLQGEPRLTHDIDLVVVITPDSAKSLVAAFPAPEYDLDAGAVANAIAHQSQFNLLDIDNGDKVDFWILTDDPFDRSRFARRQRQTFAGLELFVSRPEDTILMKLRWAQMSGGSEKQLGDAKSVFDLQEPLLDLTYMNHWAQVLQIEALWKQLTTDTHFDSV